MTQRTPKRRTHEPLVKFATYSALVLISALMIFPFVWMLVSSLKPFEEIFAGDDLFTPAAHPR